MSKKIRVFWGWYNDLRTLRVLHRTDLDIKRLDHALNWDTYPSDRIRKIILQEGDVDLWIVGFEISPDDAVVQQLIDDLCASSQRVLCVSSSTQQRALQLHPAVGAVHYGVSSYRDFSKLADFLLDLIGLKHSSQKIS